MHLSTRVKLLRAGQKAEEGPPDNSKKSLRFHALDDNKHRAGGVRLKLSSLVELLWRVMQSRAEELFQLSPVGGEDAVYVEDEIENILPVELAFDTELRAISVVGG